LLQCSLFLNLFLKVGFHRRVDGYFLNTIIA